MMSAANSLTEQSDRTCVSYRLYTNTLHCPEAFCISHKHSSFLLEIKAADWQNVGCATYLLSGHISKTSRNRCRKLTSSRSSTSTHYICVCATFLSIDLFYGFLNFGFLKLRLCPMGRLMIKALLSLVSTPFLSSFFSQTYTQPISTLLLIKDLWTGLMVIWSSINSLD